MFRAYVTLDCGVRWNDATRFMVAGPAAAEGRLSPDPPLSRPSGAPLSRPPDRPAPQSPTIPGTGTARHTMGSGSTAGLPSARTAS